MRSRIALSFIRSFRRVFAPKILHRYILHEFLQTLLLCLLGASCLFLVFDFFERIRIFMREDASALDVIGYLFFKLPLIIQLMTPVAVLVATLVTVTRLSQQNEITAMRSCGASLFWLSKPLLGMGLLISVLMFLAGETIIPWSTERVEDIYHFEIKRKAEKGTFSRAHFWLRLQDKFLNIGFYDSRSSTIHGLSIYEFDSLFRLRSRTDARAVVWKGPSVGWLMRDIIETTFDETGSVATSRFQTLPLPIKFTPKDFLKHERSPETLSYPALEQYIEKLHGEGVPVSKLLVQLDSKIAFPLVNVVVILIAIPFSLSKSRSRTPTGSFVIGVMIGFGYYFVNAFATSFGAAELIPIGLSAWTANILFGTLGGYLLTGAEHP